MGAQLGISVKSEQMMHRHQFWKKAGPLRGTMKWKNERDKRVVKIEDS
jgi:hypothetical protein